MPTLNAQNIVIDQACLDELNTVLQKHGERYSRQLNTPIFMVPAELIFEIFVEAISEKQKPKQSPRYIVAPKSATTYISEDSAREACIKLSETNKIPYSYYNLVDTVSVEVPKPIAKWSSQA